MNYAMKLMNLSDLQVGDYSRFLCNTCKVQTVHKLSFVQQATFYSGDVNNIWEDEPYVENWEFRVWVCQGCQTTCLQQVLLSSSDNEASEEILSYIFYPDRESSHRQEDVIVAKRYDSISKKLDTAYKEAILTYNADLSVSCAIVLRALLEAICVDQGIDDGFSRGLEGKIDQLKEKGILPENIAFCLHSFKFMGDHAAHSLEIAERSELRLAIEVMEDILNSLYEVNYRLSQNARKLADLRTLDFAKQAERRKKRRKEDK